MAAEEVVQYTCNGDESSPVYEAHPLNVSDSTNIRLLSFAPTSSLDDPTTISLDIGVFPFNESPPYTALSYVWGQDPPSKEIFLDKHLVKVRPNLWDFLDRARHDDSITYLWVDALCIDQSSIPERNHQVAIMGPIYENAEMVIVWLGAGPPGLVEAFRRLTLTDWSRINLLRSFQREGGPSTELLLYMSTLTGAEYWCRMWTIQEYALASKIFLWCGHYGSITTAVVEMCGMISRANRVIMSDNGISKVWRYVILRREHHEGGTRRDLPQVLDNCSGYLGQCSDLKDRIYSILSLAVNDDFTSYPIDVDYGQSTCQLFFYLIKRRFRQLDEGNEKFWLRSYYLYTFTRHLAEYLGIRSDEKVALTVSEIDRLHLEPRKNLTKTDCWRQMGRLISH